MSVPSVQALLSSPHQLEEILGAPINDVVSEDMAGSGGLSGELTRLKVNFKSGDANSFVIKTHNPKSVDRSKTLGLAREALFYKCLAPHLTFLPGLAKTFFSEGDMATGEKIIIFEDLKSCIQSGYFFGPGSPHNWGKDLAALTSSAPDVTVESISSQAFATAAQIHAKYWGDKSLLDFKWLRGSDWWNKEGQDTFYASQKQIAGYWAAAKDKIAAGESNVNWDPLLLACMDSSIAKISFESFQERIQSQPWTLVHGDFHPANMMYDGVSKRLVLLDWEAVGVGSGPQDLGQYVISHMNPTKLAECEKSLVEPYYAALVEGGVKDLTYDACYKEFVYGGAERWVWLMGILTAMCPEPLVQYFQDQLASFLKAHDVTPESIGQPRP